MVMQTLQRPPATTGLVESGAPDWAQRLGLRLSKTFLNLFPTAPVRLWSVPTQADLPAAADWAGCVAYTEDGALWASNGATWTKIGPAAAQTDSVTPPQFDNDTSIATTAWVNRVGKQYSSYLAPTVNTVLTAAQAGAFVQFNGNNLIFTLPSAAATPAGATITLWSAGTGNSVKAAGSDVIWLAGGVNVATQALGQGDTLEVMSMGSGGWVATEFIRHPAHQYAGEILITATGTTTLTAAQAGSEVVIANDNVTLVLPLISTLTPGMGFNVVSRGVNNHIKPQGADLFVLYSGGTGSDFTLNNDTLTLTVEQPGYWHVTGGSGQLPLASVMSGPNWVTPAASDNTTRLATTAFVQRALQFGSSLAANGYQKLPSGLIIQWGSVLCSVAGTIYTFSFPIPFPSGSVGSFQVTLWSGSAAGNYTAFGVPIAGVPVTQAQVSANVATYVTWLAIGW